MESKAGGRRRINTYLINRKLILLFILTLCFVFSSILPAFAYDGGYLGGVKPWSSQVPNIANATDNDLSTYANFSNSSNTMYRLPSTYNLTDFYINASSPMFQLNCYNSSMYLMYSIQIRKNGLTHFNANGIAWITIFYTGNDSSKLFEFDCYSSSNAPVIPSVPSGINVSGSGGNGVLSWGLIPGATSYNVYDGSTLVTSGVTGSSYSFSNFSVGSHNLTVTAVNDIGESAPSVPATYIVLAKPGQVVGLVVSGSGDPNGVVTWTASDSSDQVLNYNLYCNSSIIASPTSNSWVFSNYSVGLYSFQVSAVNSSGEGQKSSILDYAVIALPDSVTVTSNSLSTNSLNLSWSTSSGATSYAIYQNSNLIATTMGTTYLINNLIPSTNYSFQIAAVNDCGQSPLSNSVNITTLGIPPSPPTGLSAGNITQTSCTLYWIKQPDATSYNVYLDGTLTGNVSQPFLFNPSFEFSNLTDGSTYSMTVTAINQWGESTASQPLNVTATIPNPVLKAMVDNGNIKLTWTGLGSSFTIVVDGEEVDLVSNSPYTLTKNPGTYQVQIIQNYNSQQYPSNVVRVSISKFTTPGATKMTGDILENAGLVIAPAGGLLALALALKGSPMLLAAAKAFLLKN
ncbi:fibronectin type III domain-containing protein [Desulfosporosinus sp. OT]|uniref:fibronectin type III domain-containing protein n=1 Tax=Desulfosporosinus sp. OT TaxID=913865 RepID=UPI0002239C9C|nr:fibronectin type III domain-containing protein [Desulfosporosinus sp. OT]EGW40150.1 fibronectin type III domain protein [Desulfosporosinus sp. OT]